LGGLPQFAGTNKAEDIWIIALLRCLFGVEVCLERIVLRRFGTLK